MTKVTVPLAERSYDIVIGAGILPELGEALQSFAFSTRVAVLSNPTVFRLYGDRVMSSLQRSGFEAFSLLIPDGEEYKDYFWAHHALTELLKQKLDRNSCIVSLGGGVIGDLTGFVASLYMRGISFVQAPTTLLAQVDSSVGGKTGVNHLLGKNMIGTFYQPRLVWADTETLRTLPPRELRCGMAEVIKYGVIRDSDFFQMLRTEREPLLSLDDGVLKDVITRSCRIKAEVVSQDEREGGLRAILNFGHTIGHAIETETGYTRLLHGEAVAIGMCLEAEMARLLGMIGSGEVSELRTLVESYGLPCSVPEDLSAEKLIGHMKIDKKALAGRMKFVLPETIGRVRVEPGIGWDVIRLALSAG
jgi:3-dehydroquinate synthase